MKTRSIWANLTTADLDRTSTFYTTLGFQVSAASGANAGELVSVSFAENKFIINFFLKDIFQANTQSRITDLSQGNEIVFSLSAESREEVDAWVETVTGAGGKITVNPYEIGQGYTFVFSDPDGHLFNVLYWPGM